MPSATVLNGGLKVNILYTSFEYQKMTFWTIFILLFFLQKVGINSLQINSYDCLGLSNCWIFKKKIRRRRKMLISDCAYLGFIQQCIKKYSTVQQYLTLLLLNTTCPVLANSVELDHLASEEANWSGSALFVIKYVNFCQKPRSSNLIG